MQQILLDLATPGMQLAKDVKDSEGRTLCGKGTILNESILSRLKKMEIIKLTVEGHPLNLGDEITLEEEIGKIEKRFSRVKRIPPLMTLKRILIDKAMRSRSE